MVENNNGAKQFVYSPTGGTYLAQAQAQSLIFGFVPLPGGVSAIYDSSGLHQYNHPDWLGSSHLFSTPTRVGLSAMAYAPFGEGYAGGSQWVQFTSTGNASTVFDTENQTGSLVDFMFRRYNPTQGRWISPDPAGLSAVDTTNPQSWNRYAYVLNNPLIAIDPDGLDCVFLNDAGDSAESIDHDSNQGECWSNGGFWADGNIADNSWVQAFSNSDNIIIQSNVNGFLAQTLAGSLNNDGTAFSQEFGVNASVDTLLNSIPNSAPSSQNAMVAIANVFNNDFPTVCSWTTTAAAQVNGFGVRISDTDKGLKVSWGANFRLNNNATVTLGLTASGGGQIDPATSVRFGSPTFGVAANPINGQVGAYVGRQFTLFGKPSGVSLTALVGKIGTNNSCPHK